MSCFRPIFRAAQMQKTSSRGPIFRSARKGTLPTQATATGHFRFQNNERRACWCTRAILSELKSFPMLTLSLVSVAHRNLGQRSVELHISFFTSFNLFSILLRPNLFFIYLFINFANTIQQERSHRTNVPITRLLNEIFWFGVFRNSVCDARGAWGLTALSTNSVIHLV